MFGTLGNSFKLLRVSWGILKSDRELIFIPLLAGGAPARVLLGEADDEPPDLRHDTAPTLRCC